MLYKSTYLESWGSGAKRIIDACREQGVEEPTWRWDGGFVIVTFKRPVSDKENPKEKGNCDIEPKENPKENLEFPKEIAVEIRKRELTESQLRLLYLVVVRPSVTLKAMAEELHITIDQVRTLRKNLEKKGIFLCRKGATRKGVWVIKFS